MGLEDRDEVEQELDERTSGIETELVENVEEEKRGYLGYDEWVENGKNPDEFQGAKAYDAYGKLIKEVKKLQKEVRTKNTTLETMAELYRKEEDRIAAKYNNYYQQQAQRLNEAEQMGDTSVVKEAAIAMSRTEQQYQADLNASRAHQQNQLVEEFKARNDDWYNNQHPDLITKAQQLALQYEREYPHLVQSDPIYLLQKVEDEIRGRYLAAGNYSNKAREGHGANYTLPPSQSTNNKGGVAAKTKLTSLSPEMREEYKNVKAAMEEIGIDYSIDTYIEFNERNKV